MLSVISFRAASFQASGLLTRTSTRPKSSKTSAIFFFTEGSKAGSKSTPSTPWPMPAMSSSCSGAFTTT